MNGCRSQCHEPESLDRGKGPPALHGNAMTTRSKDVAEASTDRPPDKEGAETLARAPAPVAGTARSEALASDPFACS
jgi:hypothetical protein